METSLSEQIAGIYDHATNRILTIVRCAVPSDSCYEALRKLILDEMGLSGAKKKLHLLLERLERKGQGRGEPNHAGKELSMGEEEQTVS